ncbi:unnamed protein product [Larinioides sclopetarius]|uniref:Uncharacterized protein n=1 Tax=Larinioides sclopetarius TaxID=280406 RepID=A0AAV1ZN62_9ARAC
MLKSFLFKAVEGFDVTAPFEFEKIRGGCFPLNCPLV